jgi:hypothetical protein
MSLLQRDPTRGIEIEVQPLVAPHVLTDDQRYVRKTPVKRADVVREARSGSTIRVPECPDWCRLPPNTHDLDRAR